MYKYENVYEPAEDSNLLLKNSKKHLKALSKSINVCEVGVGSGFVLSNLAKDYPKCSYFGSDINPDAISLTKDEFEELKLKVTLKDKSLLSGFKDKFSLILFNTPYFPFESKFDSFEILPMKDRAIYGGKKGYEVIEEFISQVNDKLEDDGSVFMIFSSLTKPKEIKEILRKSLFEFGVVEEESSFFEKIICLKFWKSDVLKELNKLKVKELKYLSAGKHSIVLTGSYKNKDSIIKIGKPQHLEKEGYFEEKLSKELFVPKLYLKESSFVIREMVNGVLIGDFFEENSKKNIVTVLNNILNSTQRMDELGINKFEMTNPYKHIYVQEDLSVKFIDFERCIFSEKPKNTTQVLQYFRRYSPMFKEKGLVLDDKKIFEISKKYKSENFKFKVNDLI